MENEYLADFNIFINHIKTPINFVIKESLEYDSYFYYTFVGEKKYYKDNYSQLLKELSDKASDNIKDKILFTRNRNIFISSILEDIGIALSLFNAEHLENPNKEVLPKKDIRIFYENQYLDPEEVEPFTQIPIEEFLNSEHYLHCLDFILLQYYALQSFKAEFQHRYIRIYKTYQSRKIQTFVPNFKIDGEHVDKAFEKLFDDLKEMIFRKNTLVLAKQTQLKQLKSVFGIGNAEKMKWYSKGDLNTFAKNIKPLLKNNPNVYDWQTKFELLNNDWDNFCHASPTENEAYIINSVEDFKKAVK